MVSLASSAGASMCGLSGFVSLAQQRAEPGLVRRMTATLQHRGPDEEGYYVDGPVALGHRRLRIIDLATGQQPVTNETGTIRVILNGEIYNFRSLTETLKRRGHRFTTSSDTEVIVHAYEEYGEDCLAHLNGMFAFVLWDAEHQTLFAARDRMGEKPFYYAERNGWFVFGSEVRALFAHPEIRRDLDLRGLSRYVTSGYLPDPHTILEGVQKLPPGHFLTVASGKVSVTRYWDLPFERPPVGASAIRSVDAWAEALWESLCASVRHRLISDVPVGIFLSGGIDSSAVTAAARAVSPEQTFKTFSIGFQEATYSEESFARVVAERLGTEHHQFTFTAADATALLGRLGTLLDEPLADPAFLPTIHLAHHARQSVTVALSGDGADELLCGYPTFLAVRPAGWLRRLPRGVVHAAARLVEAIRKPELPPQAVLPWRRALSGSCHPAHDGGAHRSRAGVPRVGAGARGLRRLRSHRGYGGHHGRRAPARSDQPYDLPPLQALSRRTDAREDGPRDHGVRGRGARALSRSGTRGADLLDAFVGEAERLPHQVRAEAGARRPPPRRDPRAAQAGLWRADRPMAARSAARAARGDARRRASPGRRTPGRRARRPMRVRACQRSA